jgi:hypothetical protein
MEQVRTFLVEHSLLVIELGFHSVCSHQRLSSATLSLLFPQPTGQSCEHAQFAKKKGCVKDLHVELGGQMRLLLDRTSPLFHAVYHQRTAAERINSQAKELGIERPKVRNQRSVERLNTLTYLIINVHALQRARSINRGLLQIR